MLARIRARSRCLYARNARRCPVLRVVCMRTGEQTYRLYNCGRCAQQVQICRYCDRGNQYCAGDCARIRRQESRCRAAQRYQRGYHGARRHAARQQVWRARQAQKVTHQGSLVTAGAVIVVSTATTTTQEPDVDIACLAAPRGRRRWPVQRHVMAPARCCFCGRVLSRFARLGPLRGGP